MPRLESAFKPGRRSAPRCASVAARRVVVGVSRRASLRAVVLRLRAPFASTAALAAALTLTPAAYAVAPRAGVSSGGLEAVPGVPELRGAVAIAYDRVPDARRGAWMRFLEEARAGGDASAGPAGVPAWHAAWDLDTGVPSRVFGEGIPAPGTVADAAVAAAHARAFLERHADLLAPGAAADDFTLITNALSGGMRTVAFVQTARLGGARVPVVGGQVSFRYRADRLFVLASEAAPAGSLRAVVVGKDAAARAARALVLREHGRADASPASLVVLPLVRSSGVETRSAWRVRVEADVPLARYDVYVDARTGEPLAREQLLRFAKGEVMIDAPVRGPDDIRKLWGARFADVVVDGTAGNADAAGTVSWEAAGPASVSLGAHGTYVAVANWGGDPATTTLSVDDGAQAPWSLASDEYGDAQLSGYVHANIAKEHARSIAPEDLGPWLDEQLEVDANRPDLYGCNAFWDGTALNFLRANGPCNNSARVADVVYHEFGHGFHQYSAKAGAGTLDPALGEGSGDFYAASITNDPLIGPGFFTNGTGLRALDGGARWPDDIDQDPHVTGLIWGGTMWDLRVALEAELGAAAGAHLSEVLFHRVLGGASNIPSTYVEALAVDDDDGNLANGTPHVCAINGAFSRHGLGHILNAAGVELAHEALGLLPPSTTPYPLKVTAKALYPQCAGPGIDAMTASWNSSTGVPFDATLTPKGDAFTGTLPGQRALTSLTYHVGASVGGADFVLPDNPADPEYQVFVGEVVPIYCNDFEHDVDGWALGDGGSNDFQWGAPEGKGGDPPAAFSGTKVIGDRLDGDGLYKVGRRSSATSPVIDVKGHGNLRLQFRRWLTVQDAAFDQATLYVNGQQA
jgi:hypothetical protein